MAIFTNKFFISAFINGNSFDENMKASAELAMMLLGYGFQIAQVEGSYDGVTEVSYMVSRDVGDDEELLVSMGAVFDQACVGFIDNDDVFHVINSQEGRDGYGLHSRVGKVSQVFIPEECLEQLDDYSSVGECVFTTESVSHLMH